MKSLKLKMQIGSALLVACVATSLGQQTPIDGRVTVEWDYPASELPGMTFNVYHSTNVALPVASWPRIASVDSTNRIALTVVPGLNLFVCTASNFWGESDFSNVATTPGLPRSDINLRVKKN